MEKEPASSANPASNDESETENILAQLTEQVWNDLGGEVPKAEIETVLSAHLTRYQEAVVRTFVPIFVYRSALADLRQKVP